MSYYVIFELTKQLIAQQSITPSDKECQKIITEQLMNLGFQITKLHFGKVKNLWATYGSGKPLVVFAGHTDVVPVGDLNAWNSDPFTATVKDDYLYGRGAADMKSSLAAMIVAITQFIKNNPNFTGSIGILITSDEEGDAINGTKKVVDYLEKNNIKIDYCIVGEPTCEKKLGDTIKNGRRGSLLGSLEIIGKQGHVAYPALAANPIHLLAPILTELTELKLCPNTSLQLSNINSGTGATNVIPANLTCNFSIRFSELLTTEKIKTTIEDIINKYNIDYKIDWHHSGNPFITHNNKLINACEKAILNTTGIKTALSTSGGTSDGRFIAPTGAAVIEFGPVNKTIHSVNECIKMDDLLMLPKIYQGILEEIF